jgi:hypothetical protein
VEQIARRAVPETDCGTISYTSDHEALSIRQLQQVNEDVAELADRAQEIAKLMLAAYGPEDPRVVRAEEIRNAIQRLQWAMERQSKIVGA